MDTKILNLVKLKMTLCTKQTFLERFTECFTVSRDCSRLVKTD